MNVQPVGPNYYPFDPSRPVRVVIQQSPLSWIAWALKWMVIMLIALAIIGSWSSSYVGEKSGLQEQWHSLERHASDKVAIISVEGTIMGDETFVKRQIDHVRNDDHFKAIVLRVDSPGGTVTGSDYIYHHLKKLAAEKRIPLVVSMGSMAASGGYYVAMAAGDTPDTIFAEPTTWTGSIGVIIPHYDFSGLLEHWHVQDDSIASDPLKMMGSPTRKFPEGIRDQEQSILKGLVDSSFESFKKIVLDSRPALRENKNAQDVVFTGRIFTAKQAQENLLVDKLGFIEEAIDRALELAKLEKNDVSVVKFQRPASMIELMTGAESRAEKRLDLASLVELTAPKAYYLCTWLPAAIASAR